MAALESPPPPPPKAPEMAPRGGLGLFLCCSSDGALPRKVRHGPASPSGAEESAARERSVSAHANAVEDDDDVHAGAPSYVGERRAGDGARHGVGRMDYASGESYEGEWAHDAPHGAGRYVFGSGSVYEGEHRRGKANGVGTMTFASGSTCSGEWRDDKVRGRAGRFNVAST